MLIVFNLQSTVVKYEGKNYVFVPHITKGTVATILSDIPRNTEWKTNLGRGRGISFEITMSLHIRGWN